MYQGVTLMSKSCSNCTFSDVCPYSRPCSNFSPADETELIEECEAQYKEEYYQAWLEYIKDFD